jgi:hypothetical protein
LAKIGSGEGRWIATMMQARHTAMTGYVRCHLEFLAEAPGAS